MKTLTENKIDEILLQYELGSKEHELLLLHIMALENQLYRDLVIIQYQLKNNEYEW
jgi:hypothetical protein